MRQAIGLDIGGTKIAAGIVTDTGDLRFRTEIKSDPSDKEKMFGKVVTAVEWVLDKASISFADIEGIGVGVPGKVDHKNGIAVFQNNLPWKGFPIAARLQEHFDVTSAKIDNDVYMAAFAEWKHHQAKRNETFVYVTISTGISSSIIHNGAFFRGAGFAGEMGLIPILSRTPNNKEYLRLEEAAAGPAIEKRARNILGSNDITTKEVFARYLQGESESKDIINGVANQIAQGLYSISCLLDPHKIVFGGSVMVHNPFLLELIKEKLVTYQIPEQQHILEKMSISALKQDNGVIGAGLRVFEKIDY